MPLTTSTVNVPSLNLAANAEDTQCMTIRLANTERAMARAIRATFSTGFLQAVVYRSSATTEQPTLSACSPSANLTDAMSASSTLHPIAVIGQGHFELDFPTTGSILTGPELEPQQMLTIEVHGVNNTLSPLSVAGTIDLDLVGFPSDGIASDLMLTGSTQISIPANATFDSGVQFQKGIAGTSVFAISTTQHSWGIEVKAWKGTSASSASSATILDSTNWSEPGMNMFNPALGFSGSDGISYECRWMNTTPTPITFGFNFSNENCFLWQYYAPAKGFVACLNGTCTQ